MRNSRHKSNEFLHSKCVKTFREANAQTELLSSLGEREVKLASDMNFIDFYSAIYLFLLLFGFQALMSHKNRVSIKHRQSIKFPICFDRKLTPFPRVEVFN